MPKSEQSKISQPVLSFDMLSTLLQVSNPDAHSEALAHFMGVSSTDLKSVVADVNADHRYELGLYLPEDRLERMRIVASRLGKTALDRGELEDLVRVETDAYVAGTELYAGVPEMLERLHAAGRKLAICSTVTALGLETAKHHGLPDMVDFCLFSCEIGVRKPDREVYEMLWQHFGCQPSDVAHFDDNPECVKGASNAGMQGWLVMSADGTAAQYGQEITKMFPGRYVSKITDIESLLAAS